MTNKKAFIFIAAALALILIAAALLYSSLSERVDISLEGTQPSAAPAEQSTVTPETQNTAAPQAQSTEEPEEDVTPAPDFTMLDAEGNTVSLSDRLGVPVVLNFWASWCGPCKNEMPSFDTLAAEYEDVDFMMVNLTDGGRETLESASKFIEQQGYSFPVYYDTDSAGAAAYYVRSIPVTYFIDADGNIRAYYTGSMSEDTLRQGIELISE